MSKKFNPGLLLLARQHRGMSQSELSRKAKVDQGLISRIENDLLPDDPAPDCVERLGTALRYPADFFYLEDGLAGLPLSIHPMNRKKASVGANLLKQVHAELNLRTIHLRRLLRSAELEPELPLPQIDPYEGGGPSEIAKSIRRAWSIPDGPIRNLTDLCERAGIVIIHCELSAGIDGVTLKIRDLPPCIFLNASSPADRMRASLAHELGHVIMHTIPTDQIEDEANEFASEFMIPKSTIRRQLAGGRKITLQWLAQQKAYWRMSMAFILYKASHAGFLTRHQSEYLWKQMSVRGWRTREPNETEFKKEQPTVFPSLVELHTKHLGYDIETLAKLLKFHPVDTNNLYHPWINRSGPSLLVVD